MLGIETTRFGRLEVEENRVIHFPEGLLGFPERKKFIMLDHKPDSPFCWLQALDAPGLAFVLTNPFLVKKDYLQNLSKEEEVYFQGNGGDLIVFALVTIPPGRAEEMTVNLLGPLVIDVGTRTGRQVILAHADYNHRHLLMAD
jgi:flagellar assembly factor FliW